MTDARAIAACLRAGGVALLPTETVYGLAAMPTFDAAVDRLFALKRRPRTRNLPVMIASQDQLAAIDVRVTDAAARLLKSRYMPGPLTIALGVGPAAPAWLEGRTEIAVRMPDHALMLAVLRETGPLFVTSANAHGLATPESLQDALAQLDGAPDVAVDGGILRTAPSTLVNCNVAPPVIERVGVIGEEAIWKILA